VRSTEGEAREVSQGERLKVVPFSLSAPSIACRALHNQFPTLQVGKSLIPLIYTPRFLMAQGIVHENGMEKPVINPILESSRLSLG
jgi:hypothetical protein